MTQTKKEEKEAALEESRAVTDASLAALGHKVTWTEGHGIAGLYGDPGYRGTCDRCGGTARIMLARSVDRDCCAVYDERMTDLRTGDPVSCAVSRSRR